MTPRQRRIIELRWNKSRKEIAGELGVSIKTVEYHIGEVLRSTKAGDDAGLLGWSLARGYVPPPKRVGFANPVSILRNLVMENPGQVISWLHFMQLCRAQNADPQACRNILYRWHRTGVLKRIHKGAYVVVGPLPKVGPKK